MPAHSLAGELRLLGASFNEETECFAIGHDRGFRVYNSDPMESWVSRDFDGGVKVVGMLHRTNFLALVGGGQRPKFPPNKVVLWDDLKEAAVMTLEFAHPVLNVLLTRTRILIVMEHTVHLYTLSNPPQQNTVYETIANPHGIAAVHGSTAAFPAASSPGRIQVIDLESGKVQTVVRAHKSPLRALALRDNLVASASTTGTIIRLFDIQANSLVHEFRRGLDRAETYSIALGPHNLAVLSDKSTLHVFDLTGANRTHLLKKMPIGQRYFGSEWSYASCQTETQGPGVLGWVGDSSLVIIWTDAGRWEKYVVLSGNELTREAWRRFEPS